MTRVRTVFVCRECGAETPRWEGRCPTCGEWNSLDEGSAGKLRGRTPGRGASSVAARPAPLGESSGTSKSRLRTELGDVDRVLGGGIVPGSVVLLGGAPGIGKSTLLLQLAGRLRERGHEVLYVSGEESGDQVAMRSRRIGAAADIGFLATRDLDHILAAMAGSGVEVLCVDSIQTVTSSGLGSTPGGVAQVREAAAAIQEAAKSAGVATFLVGHVTKGGSLAGPRTLEHLVDVVLHFEGQRSGENRLLRSSKNRFGSVDEMAAFSMEESGLRPVADPSSLFLTDGAPETSGAAVAIPLHGSRPLPAEVQALVARSRFSNPQRISTGFPSRRLAILLAVMEKRAGVTLGDHDVFLNVVGGLRMSDPAADLAVVAALASAGSDRPYRESMAFVGEVGLGGEVRAVSHGLLRIRAGLEAGLDSVIAPAALEADASGEPRVRCIRHVGEIGSLLESGDRR